MSDHPWIDEYLRSLHNFSTLETYGRTLRNQLSRVGDPATATFSDVGEWIARRRTEVAGTTANRDLAIVSSFFTWLGRMGRHPGPNPCIGHNRPAAPREYDGYVSLADLDAMLAHCPDGSWRNLFVFSRLAGLRCHEIRKLSWAEVDRHKRLVYVRPKVVTRKSKPRQIPVSSAMHDRVDWSVNSGPCHGLRSNIYWGTPSPSSIYEAAGFRHQGRPLHELRACCARDWLDRPEFGDMTVCKWMGHSHRVAYNHYAQPRPAAIAAAQQ